MLISMQNFVCEAYHKWLHERMKNNKVYISGEIKNTECSALVAEPLSMLVMRCLKVLVGKSEENAVLGKPGNRQGDDIKIYLKEL